MALTDKLTAIGDAIREKTGSTDLMTLEEMPNAIATISTGTLPEYLTSITGDCKNLFSSPVWNTFLKDYGKDITTHDLVSCSAMFENNMSVESIDFDFNFSTNPNHYHSNTSMFNGCSKVKHIGDFYNCRFRSMAYMFCTFKMLRELPKFNNCDFSLLTACNSVIYNASSLRSVVGLIENLNSTATASYNSVYNSLGYYCYALDEMVGMPVETAAHSSNVFSTSFGGAYRLKRLTFRKQENGSPYVVNWKNQIIDLSVNTGFQVARSVTETSTNWSKWDNSNITGNNSGITNDKYVYNDETYQALKNDPDWFCSGYDYSRYNKISAIETIYSLPDCSGSGGTNTIKFRGEAGRYTDGGAINTMTDAEIAVAAAKGWTVSFV